MCILNTVELSGNLVNLGLRVFYPACNLHNNFAYLCNDDGDYSDARELTIRSVLITPDSSFSMQVIFRAHRCRNALTLRYFEPNIF